MSVPAKETPLPGVTAHVCVLDHDHRIGATRHHASGGNGHSHAAADDSAGNHAGMNRLFGELNLTWNFL
jgi:hypothetical protein